MVGERILVTGVRLASEAALAEAKASAAVGLRAAGAELSIGAAAKGLKAAGEHVANSTLAGTESMLTRLGFNLSRDVLEAKPAVKNLQAPEMRAFSKSLPGEVDGFLNANRNSAFTARPLWEARAIGKDSGFKIAIPENISDEARRETIIASVYAQAMNSAKAGAAAESSATKSAIESGNMDAAERYNIAHVKEWMGGASNGLERKFGRYDEHTRSLAETIADSFSIKNPGHPSNFVVNNGLEQNMVNRAAALNLGVMHLPEDIRPMAARLVASHAERSFGRDLSQYGVRLGKMTPEKEELLIARTALETPATKLGQLFHDFLSGHRRPFR